MFKIALQLRYYRVLSKALLGFSVPDKQPSMTAHYSPGYFKTSYRPRAEEGIGAMADSDSDLRAHSLGGSAAKAHIWSCLIGTRPRSP